MERLQIRFFSGDQHGLMNERSTVTQLLETFDYWTASLDTGLGVEAIYLDFQKAFDLVPHQRLLRKIGSYRTCGIIFKWIKAFLTDRQQKVIVKGEKSDWANVDGGIPQCSVLGPILFIISINDMPGETICPIKLFADDAKLFHSQHRTRLSANPTRFKVSKYGQRNGSLTSIHRNVLY